MGPDGKPVQIGNQEDVGGNSSFIMNHIRSSNSLILTTIPSIPLLCSPEKNDLFLKTIARGFEYAGGNPPPPSPQAPRNQAPSSPQLPSLSASSGERTKSDLIKK